MFTDHSTAIIAAATVLLFLVGRYVFLEIQEAGKIRALGGRAPRITSWVPLGLGFIAQAVDKGRRHENLNFWQYLMTQFANPSRPFTIETANVGQRIIFTIDEENIKAILATQFNDYGKGARFHEEWHDFLGDSEIYRLCSSCSFCVTDRYLAGIFTTDGDMWHSSRQLIRPQFIKDRVSDLHIFEKHVNVLLPLLSDRRPGVSVDLVDIFCRYTLDAATDFLLGRSVQSLQNPTVVFADAFAQVQATQGLIARTGPLNKFVSRKAFYKNLQIVDGFIQPFIEETLHLSPEELEKKSKSDEGYTFLHALASFTRDPKVLRDQIIAVLLAGRDTTAMTLSWTFYELSRKPEIVAKLRQEIKDTVGMDKAPTYADLKSMRYLQHTMNEVLRLYPNVPYNVRISLKDTTLPRGGGTDGMQPIGILKGTPIGYSTLAMQRRDDIYPPPSEKFPHHLKFSPERWDSWTPKSWTCKSIPGRKTKKKRRKRNDGFFF